MNTTDGGIPQNDGQTASDLDFSTTATAQNAEPGEGAAYPGHMSTGGYGGSESMNDEPADETDRNNQPSNDDDTL